ncbi:MAG: DUF1697 domain-containing protein [Firmicutes bacterium]|nr:DUF1697 domain-containing protein [Bacillota bacterium]
MIHIALLQKTELKDGSKISVGQLKEVFLKCGFTGVRVVLTGGNVIFYSKNKTTIELRIICEEALRKAFGTDIKVVVFSDFEYVAMHEHAAKLKWWNVGDDKKHNAFFAVPPANGQTVLDELGALNKDLETVSLYNKRVIFWSAPSKSAGRGKFMKALKGSIGKSLITRKSEIFVKLTECLMQK